MQKGLWYHHRHHHDFSSTLPPTPITKFPLPYSNDSKSGHPPRSLAILQDLSQRIRISNLPSKLLSPLPHALNTHRGSPHPLCQRPARVLLARGSRSNGAVARGTGGQLHGHDAAKGSCARSVLTPHQADVVLAGDSARAGLGGGDGGGQGEVCLCAGLGGGRLVVERIKRRGEGEETYVAAGVASWDLLSDLDVAPGEGVSFGCF